MQGTAPFSDPRSVTDLLISWKGLDDQAEEAAADLHRHSADALALLHHISERIQTGRWHTTDWNIFDVLGRVWREDAHSDTLAWLFRPWEAHGLGHNFLRDFLAEATGGRSLPNSRVIEVETRKQINRERKKIDIHVQGDGWVLAVENKIDSIESEGQTKQYAEYYTRLEKAGVSVFAVLLTRKGGPAGSGLFKPMSYRALRKVLEQNQMRCTADTAQLVGWFAEHIKNDLEKNS